MADRRGMRTEHRNGLDLGMLDLGDGRKRTEVTNWPDGLTYYTDNLTQELTRVYTPGVVHSDPDGVNVGGSRVGIAFPPEERHLEEVVHPVVAISKKLGEFAGFDMENYPRVVGCINWYLERLGTDFRTNSNSEAIGKSVKAGYLREEMIKGDVVYFPTEKSVRAMCNKRFEDFMFALGIHTGVNMRTGYRKAPSD